MFEGIDRLIIMYREHQMDAKQRQALHEKLEKEQERAQQEAQDLNKQQSLLKMKTGAQGNQISIRERIKQTMIEIEEKA